VVLLLYRSFIRRYELLQHLLHLATPLSRYTFLHEGPLVLVQQQLETKQLASTHLQDKHLLQQMETVQQRVYILHQELQLEMELVLQPI
jgi:hypothetical protein